MFAIKKEKSLNEVQRVKKEERRMAHQGNIIKKVKKELQIKQKEIDETIVERKQAAVHEQDVREKLGLNFKPERIGMKKYK